MVPVRELPYGPAACRCIKGRTDGSIRLRVRTSRYRLHPKGRPQMIQGPQRDRNELRWRDAPSARLAQHALQPLEAMGRARRVHANDGGAGCGRTARWAYSLASRAGDRATTRSDTISAAIGDVTGSRSCSVASKTGAASRPATIAGRAPSFPPLPSRPRLYSHRDQRVLTLAMCAERLQGPKPAERG